MIPVTGKTILRKPFDQISDKKQQHAKIEATASENMTKSLCDAYIYRAQDHASGVQIIKVCPIQLSCHVFIAQRALNFYQFLERLYLLYLYRAPCRLFAQMRFLSFFLFPHLLGQLRTGKTVWLLSVGVTGSFISLYSFQY